MFAAVVLLSLRLVAAAALHPSAPDLSSPELASAETALLHGRVAEATAILEEVLVHDSRNSQAHLLLCRVYYSQDMADPAIKQCESSINGDAPDSTGYMWLARAYGLKASKASPLPAFQLARKVHRLFEQAAADPANVQAASDLGEFYVAAPGIVGGGMDKADQLADTLQSRSSTRAHRLRGQIAVKRNDLTTAEAEFKKAVAASSNADALVDLAQFYQVNHQYDLAAATIDQAIAADKQKDAALVDCASILTAANRSPALAERLLRDYLRSSAQSDDAPAFKVHLQLGDLLRKRNDLVGAQQEYRAAAALAPLYAPAQKAIHN